MDASLMERLSTGTLSLLGGVPQRSTPVFRSLNLQFVFHHPFCNLKTTRLQIPYHFQRRLTFRRQELEQFRVSGKVVVNAELLNYVCQLSGVERKEEGTEH